MNKIDFTFSDLIAGYVTQFDETKDTFSLKTSDNREFLVQLAPTAFGELVRNLGEAYRDATAQMREMLVPGRFVFAYGIFYPDGENGDCAFAANHLVFLGRSENEYLFETQNWWIKQVRQLADFYLEAEFGDGEIDYSEYRTNLTIAGDKQKSGRQETDTISRLVYGFASAYLLTGEDRFLEAAEKGTKYLREHMRFRDESEGICYWYHAVDIKADGSEQKIFASEFGDDYDAIPCYEQIYALAGPTQTYRVTGDRLIKDDIKATVNLFHRFFKDKSEKGGYYSHIDPITLSPYSESLGRNRAKKNWNSVGDHAPAYLINLWLATGEPEYADFLEYTFDTIAAHFPDYDASPFVQEKFNDDWSKDYHTVQQNRAIVGHNLKIAWNLTRMHSLNAKETYKNFAEKIGHVIPGVGCDRQRGGWYDMEERVLAPGQKFYRLVWHDRKAWWQQEQGILAYYIMAGVYQDPDFIRFAREGAAFYNAWFLDTESGGVYFNVLANGQPYALGTERGKGSHSMAGYHSFELCYLAAIYINLLINQEPMDFYFKPMPGGFPDNILRVQPDILPPGSIRIGEVWLNGHKYTNFDPEALTIELPTDRNEMKFRVRIVPAGVDFDADLIEVSDGVAKIDLAGSLEPSMLKYFKEELEKAHGVKGVILNMQDLKSISDEALRYLAFYKQKAGSDFSIAVLGAEGSVKAAIEQSELNEEISLLAQ
jgi:mannose/cellobiose epimerase-like protein (N-acyl-D-glucosamine 2-epimerase family)/anti-anti-sigma regulatory factor